MFPYGKLDPENDWVKLAAFRKRFSEQDLAAILEASVPKEETERQDDSEDGNDPPNSETLILDAACRESEGLWRAVARYRERCGCYPQRILVDKLYHNRQTLAFCKEHGIRLSGPALGKPPKDSDLSRQAKRQEDQDSCDRNAVEGVFGTAKTAYGLGRVMARLRLLFNLSRSLRAALALFCLMFWGIIFSVVAEQSPFML